jgi:GvpD gas vesicle protein.
MDTFFGQKFGKSLVVKGRPGAGKTTFALGYLEGVLKEVPVCYLSSRFSDDSLFQPFPWLKDVSIRNMSNGNHGETVNVSKESLQKLERMIEEGQISSSINKGLILNISDLLPEIRSMYEFVDRNYGNSPLIVIDSMEALSEKYDMSSLTLFSVIHSDLVERSGANLIIILEAKENQKLEYFSDGVVSMDYFVESDFLVRNGCC